MGMRELIRVDWRERRLPRQHPHHFLSGKIAHRADCLLRVVGSVRGNNYILQPKQWIRRFPVAQLRRLLLNVVQTGARNPALFQGAIERLVVHN